LIEILELIVGESEIAGWRPVTLTETLSRINEPLAFCIHGAQRR
jgi:hypothetical protein